MRRKRTKGLDPKAIVSFKELKCNTCENIVDVDEGTKEVLCWKCACALTEPPVIKKTRAETDTPATRNPKGWRFMKVFVNADGVVYHKGVEQPELKGTLPITVIEPKAKKSTAQKEIEKVAKEAKLAARYEKKKLALKKAEDQKQKQLDQLTKDAQ